MKWQSVRQSFNINSFVIHRENDDGLEEIASMPGVSRFGVNSLRAHLEPLIAKGLSSILLFGVIEKLPKVNRMWLKAD